MTDVVYQCVSLELFLGVRNRRVFRMLRFVCRENIAKNFILNFAVKAFGNEHQNIPKHTHPISQTL